MAVTLILSYNACYVSSLQLHHEEFIYTFQWLEVGGAGGHFSVHCQQCMLGRSSSLILAGGLLQSSPPLTAVVVSTVSLILCLA